MKHLASRPRSIALDPDAPRPSDRAPCPSQSRRRRRRIPRAPVEPGTRGCERDAQARLLLLVVEQGSLARQARSQLPIRPLPPPPAGLAERRGLRPALALCRPPHQRRPTSALLAGPTGGDRAPCPAGPRRAPERLHRELARYGQPQPGHPCDALHAAARPPVERRETEHRARSPVRPVAVVRGGRPG